jgi:hypothetical protein
MRGEGKIVAITNLQGEYILPSSVDDTWTVQIEMSGFSACKGSGSTTIWELNLLPFEEMHAEIIKPEATNAAIPSRAQADYPKPNIAEHKISASANPPELQSTSGLFDNKSPEELNQSAMEGSVINGSINDGTKPSMISFGNNRFRLPMISGNIAASFGNARFDAKPYSLSGQKSQKPDYNNYTASLNFGGILRIPYILEHSRQYFFLSFERRVSQIVGTAWGRVPTEQERGGDFSRSVDSLGQGVQLTDPNTKSPLAGNIIRQSQMSAQSLSLLKLFPKPNTDNLNRTNYQTPVLSDNEQDDMSLRLDNSASNSIHHYAGIFKYASGDNNNINIYKFLDASKNSSLSFDLDFQTSIGPRLSSEFKYKFHKQTALLKPYFSNHTNISGNAGILGNNQEDANWGPPNLIFSNGISSLMDAQFSHKRILDNEFSYSGSWFNRKHNVSFGGGIQWNQFNLVSQQDARGTFIFTGIATGDAFADFLFGFPATSSIAFGNADKYFRQKFAHLFISDNFKLRSNLTLNSGIRWEYESPIDELRGRLVNLSIAPDFSSTVATIGNGLIKPDRAGIEPRIGIAWRPGISSMVVRASYGVYRNTNVYRKIAIQMAQQYPLSKSMILQYDQNHPTPIRDVFTIAQPTVLNTFAVDPNFHVGYAQNWLFSIQNNLPASLQITLTYLGIKGTHLPQESLPNTFPFGAVSPSGYAYLSSSGNSIRHAGTVQLRRRLHNGFVGNMEYTFSKAIDNSPLMDGSRIVGAGEGGADIAQNWLDLRAERSVSNFHQKHKVTAQMQYMTGMGVRGGTLMDGWRGALLSDWGVQGELKAGSGFPQTPVYFAPLKGVGVVGNLRPDYTGKSIQAAPPGLFINPGAFSAPALNKWGNAGRNCVRGPAQFELNVSLGRTFKLSRRNLDVRVEAANVLNHVAYTSWNTVINNVQFGLPNGVAPMRTIRFFLRLRFDRGVI